MKKQLLILVLSVNFVASATMLSAAASSFPVHKDRTPSPGYESDESLESERFSVLAEDVKKSGELFDKKLAELKAYWKHQEYLKKNRAYIANLRRIQRDFYEKQRKEKEERKNRVPYELSSDPNHPLYDTTDINYNDSDEEGETHGSSCSLL
ncbi:hypothetical protein K2X40_03730 [Candidatus Babeliales bacterium]|nr:hypothetical protein [Candidatus Babeliales bacterium]